MSKRRQKMQTTALAETYARPLFQLARRAGQVDEVGEQLDEIIGLLGEHPALREVFVHKAIDPERRAKTIERLFAGRADDLLVRFLLVLNGHGRLEQLEAVRGAYDQAVKASRNQVDVTVYTAQPLAEEQYQAVVKRLSEALGREAIVHLERDDRMIGGLRIRFEDKLIDASVASRLRRMARQLATRGHDAVRGAAGRLLVVDGEGEGEESAPGARRLGSRA